MPQQADNRFLLNQNWRFFLPYCLMFLACTIYLLVCNQGDLILFFSENRTTFGDTFFKYATKIGEEPTYVLITLTLLFFSFRKALLFPLIGIVVTLVSNVTKSFYLHQRPWAWFNDNGGLESINFIEGVPIHKAMSSFPSGHTMSAFALFCMLALISKNKRWGWFFFSLAFIVGLSRIYLVQHFVKDIWLGSMIGVFIAISLYLLQDKILFNPNKWYDKRIKV